jgi:hypothetical protein
MTCDFELAAMARDQTFDDRKAEAASSRCRSLPRAPKERIAKARQGISADADAVVLNNHQREHDRRRAH